MNDIFPGGCLCGAVRYEAGGPLRSLVVCHCGQCRKWHGAAPSYTATDRTRFKLTKGEADVGWYASSDSAKRGFCRKCGSSMFWRGDDRPTISIAAGTLDGPTGLQTTGHIYVADKADYEAIGDGLPQHARSG
ncbi:MAG: GFA family protein [Alphaproteobacteria bacterium]|nr:GFA family protein [Alphaproteobacteria bacterium]